jgi:hypothetical protein
MLDGFPCYPAAHALDTAFFHMPPRNALPADAIDHRLDLGGAGWAHATTLALNAARQLLTRI